MFLLKFWPGLDYLVRHGSFRAWLAAIFYAFFAMAVIGATLLWDGLLPAGSQTTLWILFGVTWVLGILLSQRFEKAFQESMKQRQQESTATDTLPLAQTAYLRQNFYEAERLLRERLAKFPEDVPARFLLISVLKRQERSDEALEHLSILERTPRLGLWGLDLLREKQNES